MHAGCSFARPNDTKNPARSQRNPMAVSSPPYAFSLIKHTGTGALSKQRKQLCLVCFKVKAGGWGLGGGGREKTRVNLQCSRTVNNSRISGEEAVMASRLYGSSLSRNSAGESKEKLKKKLCNITVSKQKTQYYFLMIQSNQQSVIKAFLQFVCQTNAICLHSFH